MFIVTGATGNTGSVVAETLLASGKQVRAVVRDERKAERLKSLGAEVVVADLSDQQALSQAVRGAEGVYLLSPPDAASSDFIAERERLTRAQVGTLAAEKVPHVVLLSSIGAQHPSGTGPVVALHNVERQLRTAGIPSTFVRAGYFLENWGGVVPAVKGDGVLPSFVAANFAVPSVGTRDIGEAAARALLDGPRGVRVIELSGPRDVTPKDIAAIFASLLGKAVNVVEPPLDAVVPTFVSFGVSENVAGLYREMYEAIASGTLVAESGEHWRGKTPVETTLRGLLV